jgi:hypothetical protein
MDVEDAHSVVRCKLDSSGSEQGPLAALVNKGTHFVPLNGGKFLD